MNVYTEIPCRRCHRTWYPVPQRGGPPERVPLVMSEYGWCQLCLGVIPRGYALLDMRPGKTLDRGKPHEPMEEAIGVT